MKAIFLMVVISVLLFSCKKDGTSTGTVPTVPVVTDTLATGWSKKILSGSPLLVDIFFVNMSGFMVTPTDIYHSSNGGKDWTKIVSNGTEIENIGMGSEMNAAFAAHSGKIVYTHNGGASLDTVVVADVDLTDVFFVSPSIAYAAGKNIWKTTDGGLHWTKLYDFTTLGGYKTLYFLNELTGWVVRSEGLYKTVDGGINWQLVNTAGQFFFDVSGDVFFVNPNHGFVADEYVVGATTNGGTNWNRIYTGVQVYHDLFFLDDNVGYMTDGDYILKTINSGATWTKEVSVPGTRFFELHFIDANHGWACGDGGTVLRYEK